MKNKLKCLFLFKEILECIPGWPLTHNNAPASVFLGILGMSLFKLRSFKKQEREQLYCLSNGDATKLHRGEKHRAGDSLGLRGDHLCCPLSYENPGGVPGRLGSEKGC